MKESIIACNFLDCLRCEKGNRYYAIMKYLSNIIDQLKSCPESLQKSMIRYLYFEATLVFLGTIIPSLIGWLIIHFYLK